MVEFLELLQNFGVPVASMVALAMYSYQLTNKVITLTEKVTKAMVENSDNIVTLSTTIERMLAIIEKESD